MNIVWQEILTHIVGFAILLALLKRYLWGPTLRMLDARSTKVRGELDQAASARKQMERAKADYERHLAEIETEARQKMQEAVADGKRIASEIQEEARHRAEATLEKAREGIELEVGKARIQLRDDMARLVAESAGRLLRERIDERKDHEMIERMLDEIQP